MPVNDASAPAERERMQRGIAMVPKGRCNTLDVDAMDCCIATVLAFANKACDIVVNDQVK